MAAPISNTTGISSLLRTQSTGNVSQAATNRQTALAATNRSANLPDKIKNITLASGNNPPPSNLPRGSIVDKLV